MAARLAMLPELGYITLATAFGATLYAAVVCAAGARWHWRPLAASGERALTAAFALVTLAGAILAGASDEQLASLSNYGEQIGLAFQIVDDILNVEGDPTLLGKETGSDAARGKVTFPALIGVEESRTQVEALIKEALYALAFFDDRAEPLRRIARYIPERKS